MKKQMSSVAKRKEILELLQLLVKPAIGCTEIGAVALAAAAAAQQLKGRATHAKVVVSQFIYRNVICIGVPMMGTPGITGIVACGLIIADTRNKLSILSGLTPAILEQVHQLIKDKVIKVDISNEVPPVYVKAIVNDQYNNVSEAVIETHHDHLSYLKLNGEQKFTAQKDSGDQPTNAKTSDHIKTSNYDIKTLMEICSTFTVKELAFLHEGIDMNEAIANYQLEHLASSTYTKAFIKTYKDSKWDKWIIQALQYVTAAIEARMDGCPLPVMSSCGSGDHGLTISIPQPIHAKLNNISEKKMLQGLAFAHLVTWIIKDNIGSLSAYCGSVVAAATAATAGIAFQRGHSFEKINNIINMCLVSNGYSICDGAKLSCTFKVLAALIANFNYISLVENANCGVAKSGLIDTTADRTIESLGIISKKIMNLTNDAVVREVDKIDQRER